MGVSERVLTCATCGEDTYVKRPGYIFGRACLCERNKQAVAAVEKLLPRCGAFMGDLAPLSGVDVYTATCGDALGHDGPHGQGIICQAKVVEEVVEEPKDAEVVPKGRKRSARQSYDIRAFMSAADQPTRLLEPERARKRRVK